MKEKVKILIDGIGNKLKMSQSQAIQVYQYYDEVYVDNPGKYGVHPRGKMQRAKCATCNIAVLNALRIFIDYPTKINETSPPIYQKRREICRDCNKLITFGGADQCGECKCFIAIKSRFKIFKCPLKKWND